MRGAEETLASPRVSLLVTTYNGAPYLGETMDSLLNQSLRDFELIIVDDASTDNTFDLLAAYDDSRIRLFRNEKNLGIGLSRNRALGLTRGEYIAASDQDDISAPERLAREVAFLDHNPGVVLVASAAAELWGGKRRSFYRPERHPHVLAWRLFTRCSIVHSTICFRRSLVASGGLRYRPEYRYAEDFVLFHEMSRAGDIVILPDELVTYREHEANASRRHQEEMSANGMRYLRGVYESELGLRVGEEESRSLWRIFMERSPAETEEELLNTGGLYAGALERFLSQRGLDAAERRDILHFGAMDWWRAVSAFCRWTGRVNGLGLYRKIGVLSTIDPAMPAILATGIRSVLRRLAK